MKLSEREKDYLFVVVAMTLLAAVGAVVAFELGWL
jgi:hypothetical protein